MAFFIPRGRLPRTGDHLRPFYTKLWTQHADLVGKVTSLFARKVVEEVHDRVDKDALLRSVGLERSGSVDPSHMIEDMDYYAFLERAAAADPHATTLPLRTGAAMRCDDYGAFGLAWKSATTLRGSYDRAERYALVLTSASTYEVEETVHGAFMHLHREGERRLSLRLSNEATIAGIASISREVASRPFRPEAVYFKHAAPASIADREAYFGCPVHFGSDRDALLVSEETLRTPNKLGDPLDLAADASTKNPARSDDACAGYTPQSRWR